MSEMPKPRRAGPPHNPDVRELVAGKRQGSVPLKREDAMQGFRGWSERSICHTATNPASLSL